MKKILATMAICGVLITSNVVANSNVHLFIDGKEKKADIILKDDRTFVPIRFISESMNYNVDYDAATKGIKISKGNETMDLQVGSKEFVKDGQRGQMDVEAFINNDRTFVPLRFIGEAFSKEVGWHQDSRSVYIGKKPSEFPNPDKNGYQVKEFPKYGFKLFVPNNFDDKILIRENDRGNGIEFHSKFADAQIKGSGLFQEYRLEKQVRDEYGFVVDDVYNDFNKGIIPVVYFDGKKIVEESYRDFSSKTKEYRDDIRECFNIVQKIIVAPHGNIFPSAKNMTTSIENGNFIYKFGNPQVIASIPLNKLDGIRMTSSEYGLRFNDRNNEFEDDYGSYGGDILYLTQAKVNKEDEEFLLYSAPGDILVKNGRIFTYYYGPNGNPFKYEDEFKNSHKQKTQILKDNLNIKVGNKNYKIKQDYLNNFWEF